MAQQYEQIFFRSRHVVQSSCWLAYPNGTLQEIQLETNQGRVVSANLTNPVNLQGVLCQFKFIGPASLEIGLQTAANFNETILVSERRQSFLEGVLYLMIGMVAVAAFMTRSVLFVSYGFWLFASLRLVALSEGWDHSIFGFDLKSEPLMRPHAGLGHVLHLNSADCVAPV